MVKLSSGRELLVLDESAVTENVEKSGFKNDPAMADLERSDLTQHIYEGGFKVWECSIDLCELIEKRSELFADKNVLELGCGAGLPGILSSLQGANSVVLQDFNACVLRCFTEGNILLNKCDASKFRLIDGPWNKITEKLENEKFDIILTSETIYNEEDVPPLHDAICDSLKDSGFCWLAAKFFYFGVGGSIPSFINYVKKAGRLTVEEIVSIDSGVPRRILELRKI